MGASPIELCEEKRTMKTKNIIRNILPSVAVMVAGLMGAYLVYQNYFEDNVALQVSTYEPAAGDELGASLDAGTSASVDTGAGISADATVDATVDATAD